MRRLTVIVPLICSVAAALVAGFLPPAQAAVKERAVCVNAAIQERPAIDGYRIVWQDKRSGNYDIYMKDLLTGLETPICTALGDQMYPDISGDIIVWQDHRSGHWDIYTYDLRSATLSVVLSGPDVIHPAIWGGIVVCELHDQ